TTWTVRGDAEGEYQLNAAYTGSLEPIGQPVRLQATTANPLKVWGGSLLHMTVEVDSCAIRFGPYHSTVTLQNVSTPGSPDAASAYNTEVEFINRPPDAPSWQAVYSLAPPTKYSTPAITPGSRMVSEFVVYPGLGNDDVHKLKLVPSESFIERTGGNASIPTDLTVRSLDCASLHYGNVWT